MSLLIMVALMQAPSCTEIIGYSQTINWFGFFENSGFIDQTRWQGRLYGGGAARYWADPNFAGWNAGISSPCAVNSGAPDRVVLDVTRDEYNSAPDVLEADIRGAVATIRLKYPVVSAIFLQPVVGSPVEQWCPDTATGVAADTVRASFNHSAIERAIDRVVEAGLAQRGPDGHLSSCAGYADLIGHLNFGYDRTIGETYARWWAQRDGASTSPPPPPPVDTTPPVITAVVASSITSSGATITWTTDKNANSQVDYGLTSAYGSLALNGNLVLAHSQTLSGLLASTLYHYRVDSKDASGNLAQSADFTFTTLAAAPSPAFTLFLDCGGFSSVTDTSGRVWQADQTYAAGSYGHVEAASSYTTAAAISGTTLPQTLYQTNQHATVVEYRVTLPNGTYNVTLHFAEIFNTAAGQRVFNVDIEGARILTNFDVFSAAGGANHALDRTFSSTVADGILNVVLTGVMGHAALNALDVQ